MSPQASFPARVITRTDYMSDSTVTHDDYYGQFVTEHTLSYVGGAFGAERLRAALDQDRHLNSIALKHWDTLTTHPVGRDGFRSRMPFNRLLIVATGETVTRAVLVCIAKRAARMLVERLGVRRAAGTATQNADEFASLAA